MKGKKCVNCGQCKVFTSYIIYNSEDYTEGYSCNGCDHPYPPRITQLKTKNRQKARTNKKQNRNTLKQNYMEKEATREKSEAQVFLDEVVEHVKEFISGHPSKDTGPDAASKMAQEQELAKIRAIRERTHLRNRRLDSLEERDTRDNSDKDETERDYE